MPDGGGGVVDPQEGAGCLDGECPGGGANREGGLFVLAPRSDGLSRQVRDGPLHAFWAVPEVTKACVAQIAQEPTYALAAGVSAGAAGVVMIDVPRATSTVLSVADGASAILR